MAERGKIPQNLKDGGVGPRLVLAMSFFLHYMDYPEKPDAAQALGDFSEFTGYRAKSPLEAERAAEMFAKLLTLDREELEDALAADYAVRGPILPDL